MRFPPASTSESRPPSITLHLPDGVVHEGCHSDLDAADIDQYRFVPHNVPHDLVLQETRDDRTPPGSPPQRPPPSASSSAGEIAGRTINRSQGGSDEEAQLQTPRSLSSAHPSRLGDPASPITHSDDSDQSSHRFSARPAPHNGIVLGKQPTATADAPAQAPAPCSTSSAPEWPVEVENLLDSGGSFDAYTATLVVGDVRRAVVAKVTNPWRSSARGGPERIIRAAEHEADCYRRLQHLQGSTVPRYFGLWRGEYVRNGAWGREVFEMYVALLEDVGEPTFEWFDGIGDAAG